MPDEPGAPAGGDQRELIARLRAVIEAQDAENAVLRAELEAQRERYRRLELRVAELERRLGADSTTSGTPPSKDPIGAREQRKAERARQRQSSERERRQDRRRGGQPGHRGAGLSRDPDPDERAEVPPPAAPASSSQAATKRRGAPDWPGARGGRPARAGLLACQGLASGALTWKSATGHAVHHRIAQAPYRPVEIFRQPGAGLSRTW